MPDRDVNLKLVLDLSAAVIRENASARCRAAAERVFGRLAQRIGTTGPGSGAHLPFCRHALDGAYSAMAAGHSPLPELAAAFAAVESGLTWARRSSSTPANQPFHDGHANAMLIGPGGLEQREDVWVGATVMAPGILYPNHSHPPEEIYLAVTEGEWWNAGMDWTRPGPGGLIYNPPGILHAMRSGAEPFLALWFLPID